MMEEVAVMVPSIVANDELSDETESINLDLHVSDTEDSTESVKKCDQEIIEQTESEEDILNKFVEDTANENAKKRAEEANEAKVKPVLPNGSLVGKKSESYEKCNGKLSPLASEKDKNSDDKVTNVKENEDLHEEEEKEKEEAENNTDKDVQSPKNEEKREERASSDVEDCEKQVSDKTDSDQTDSDKKPDSDDKMDTEEPETSRVETKASSDKSENVPDTTDETASKNTNETKADDSEDNDDLLCVMEEKTVEEANENKDENSSSASEREDESKENEESNNEETKEDEEMEEQSESQAELDMDASECAMDIEESDIGGVVYTDQDRTLRVNRTDSSSSDDKIGADKEANKENVFRGVKADETVVTSSSASVEDEVTSENGLTNGVTEEVTKEDDATHEEQDAEIQKKSTKRQLSDATVEGESENAKKMRLQAEEVVEKPPEKRAIILLDSFKKFMLDKKLKNLTRYELEELCMQKMCECIVNKSEIGELRQKIMIQEQTIDTWRKEAIVVAKQTRDLKIVHERLMADLKVMKEQTGKPLVPVKITRSVGLQAIIENPPRARTTPIMNGTNTPPQRSPVVNNNTLVNKNVPSPQNRQPAKPKVQPQRVTTNNSRPLQPITQKDNVNNAKPRQAASSPQQQNKKNADPKAVIDLTDEDEKNQNAKQATNTASPTVRILNKQTTNASPKPVVSSPNSQASKIMFVSPNVLSRNSAVMVKMNANGIVNPQNGLTTIANGQVSVVTSPVVRTVSQVRVPVSSVSTVRTVTGPKPPFKHPAPLPAAPSYQGTVGKKPIPPRPHLNLTRSSCGTGIVLQWKMPYKLDTYETIVSYQLYAYQETKAPPKTDNWGKIGDVKALELPMAVTLTQFAVGNRYFFAVRAVDGQKRLGPFSEPENILL